MENYSKAHLSRIREKDKAYCSNKTWLSMKESGLKINAGDKAHSTLISIPTQVHLWRIIKKAMANRFILMEINIQVISKKGKKRATAP